MRVKLTTFLEFPEVMAAVEKWMASDEERAQKICGPSMPTNESLDRDMPSFAQNDISSPPLSPSRVEKSPPFPSSSWSSPSPESTSPETLSLESFQTSMLHKFAALEEKVE